MLQAWAPIQDVVTKRQTQANSAPPAESHQETTEHREHRLRSMYEQALKLQQEGHMTAAQTAFQNLVAQLNDRAHSVVTRSGTSSGGRPIKRPRLANLLPQGERRLRYGTFRNLAETCLALGEYSRALQAFSNALDYDHSDFLVWCRAGRAATASGRLHVARRAFENALTMRPRHFLAAGSYRALLAAIGDPDDDVVTAPLGEEAAKIAGLHARALVEEGNAAVVPAPEELTLNELSWVCLVDVLRKCVERRLISRVGMLVGHPVTFSTPASPDVVVEGIVSSSSDEVVVVAEKRNLKRKIDETGPDLVEVAEVQVTSKSERKPNMPTDSDVVMLPRLQSEPSQMPNMQSVPIRLNTTEEYTVVVPPVEATIPQTEKPNSEEVKVVESGGDEKKTEVRRSARRANANANATSEAERRTTRTAAELTRSQLEDAHMIRVFLDMCYEKGDVGSTAGTSNGMAASPSPELKVRNAVKVEEPSEMVSPEEIEKLQASSWQRVIAERQEALRVSLCIKSFENGNSGPADLLLRILAVLTKIDTVQYFSTLALLWLTIRERLNLNVPGPPHISALIVEALLVSGRKAGKQKARRFREAGRLLSQIRLSETSQDHFHLLSIRIAWLWGMLHDCRGEMQLSFLAAERSLALIREVKGLFKGPVLAIAGPELSGYTGEALEAFVRSRISRLKSARDLEKAEELLKTAAGDTTAAERTVSILAPSVYSTVKSLELDRWHANDLKFDFATTTERSEWEARLDAEIDLEPTLKVLSDACTRAGDAVGELVCFSVRLRMAVHYYTEKVRSENESAPQEKDSDSSSTRIADLLVQIRRFVMLIKKLSSSYSTGTLVGVTNPELCGWSLEEAVTMVATTIVSLTEMLITLIPLAKYSTASSDLGAAQKNRRLGFTRCMLAFPRCIMILHRFRSAAKQSTPSPSGGISDSALTRKMLFVTSFCLKALVARGCCREEGTSGALIKLYAKYLATRLQEIASHVNDEKHRKDDAFGGTNADPGVMADPSSEHGEEDDIIFPIPSAASPIHGSDPPSKNNQVKMFSCNYSWSDVRVIRHELTQCFQCLYQIPELETVSGDDTVLDGVRWLEEGCRVSKHIGLAFVGGHDMTGAVSVMDVDVCRNIYFFYRKRIFEAVCLRRRDGGRVKRLREVLSRLAEALPEDAPTGVSMLSFQALDTIVSDVVDSNTDICTEAAENVSKLEEEWNLVVENSKENSSVTQRLRNVQLSVMYFEVFSLHAMSILDIYEAEYKKQKNAERRKRPKDIADRLLTASSECLIALRCRPWSIGAWILLGRIFVEISDLALDERELCFSSFGLYRTEDIASLGDGDSIQTNFGRAEACFGFADSLLRHSWAKKTSSEVVPIDVSLVLGFAYDGNDSELWHGFGDDGDLFGSFGLTNETTSRPVLESEPHPSDIESKPDVCRLAAIRLGSSTLSILRLREARYFHLHWTLRSLHLRILTHPANQFPRKVVNLSSKALNQLTEGIRLLEESARAADMIDIDSAVDISKTPERVVRLLPRNNAEWRLGYNGLGRIRWYYTLMEAKLLRKCGRSHLEYLPVFQRALTENYGLRDEQRQPRDIEPLYQLHASRMKILRTVCDNADAMAVLTTLERFSFERQVPIVVDDVNDDEDWVTVRCIAIAEDIMSAMQACTDSRSEVAYTEFYFKSTFCKAVLLAEILKDVRGATEELGKLFRLDAAARVLDQGPDGIYRGYFYKLWNYRYTDTGVEPALETERKLIRWRSKLLGLYGQLLRQIGEWRLIAAIILRLKKRSAEDLPVDGAILDDFIEAYAETRSESILSSMEKGIVTDAVAFETSYRMTWDIYVESLRLSHGAKRVRVAVLRDELGGTGEDRVVVSGRPRCLTSIHTTLRIEHLRWKAAVEGRVEDINSLRLLPMSRRIGDLDPRTKISFVDTLRVCRSRWPLDDKLMKVLSRRISEFGGMDGANASMGAGTAAAVGNAADGMAGSINSMTAAAAAAATGSVGVVPTPVVVATATRAPGPPTGSAPILPTASSTPTSAPGPRPAPVLVPVSATAPAPAPAPAPAIVPVPVPVPVPAPAPAIVPVPVPVPAPVPAPAPAPAPEPAPAPAAALHPVVFRAPVPPPSPPTIPASATTSAPNPVQTPALGPMPVPTPASAPTATIQAGRTGTDMEK